LSTTPTRCCRATGCSTLARNREAGPFDRTIDVQVGRLRRKLEDDPQNPSLIKTVRGSGYIFTPTVDLDRSRFSHAPARRKPAPHSVSLASPR
jgi:two-component system OmpR family response regulator